MSIQLSEIYESVVRRLRQLSDPESRFEMISDALEMGDFHFVLDETNKIISRCRFVRRVFPRVGAKTMLFNSSEEYNNFIRRNPAQSFVGWEFPLAPEAHFHRALVYERTGRLRSSREEIEKSLLEFPDSAKYLTELGYILLNMKYYFEAARSFEQAIVKDLTDDRLYSVRSKIGMAMLYLEQAAYAAARRELSEARQLAPANREILNHLHVVAELENDCRQRAEYFLSLGNHQLAVDAYLEALNINPHDFEMQLGLAYAYKELQRFALAEKHIKKAFPTNPGSSQVNFALGWVYLMQEKTEEAEAEILKAIKKNPYDGGYFVGLSYVYLERVKDGQEIEGDRLLAAAKQAIELDSQLPEPHIIISEYYLIVDRLADARKAVLEAIRLSPGSQTAHVLAAEIFLEMGQKRRSIHHLSEAEDFGRDTEEMRMLRDRLKGDAL
jgi:tetratricopeptide (TPR) repeat protein